jgi:hypothetical protein
MVGDKKLRRSPINKRSSRRVSPRITTCNKKKIPKEKGAGVKSPAPYF